MKLSMTLPSLFPGPAMRVIENVRETVRGIDYEILLVGPTEIAGPNVRWIKEETPRGIPAAHEAAFLSATGDVVFPLADDIELKPGWASAGLEALLKFERGRPYAVGIGQTNQIVGTVFGIYYPFFPMVRRSTLDAVGGFFLPRYRQGFVDPDLALRIWSIGGACGFTEGAFIDRISRGLDPSATTALEKLEASKAALADADTETFVRHWGARYGQGWTTDHYTDFNIDVDPIFRMFVADGNTIYVNNALFAAAHRRYLRNRAGLRFSVQIEVSAVI
jgi:hypothetical protein